MKQYKTLDLAKFVCALLIIVLHTAPFTLMRKYSILMFLTQRIPLSILGLFLSETVLVQNSILYFVVVLSATLLISFSILKASERFAWLKYAY